MRGSPDCSLHSEISRSKIQETEPVHYVSSGVEAILGRFLQLATGQSSELLVEGLQGVLADELRPLPGHDHVEQDLGQTLDPDWEVIHTRGP